MTQAVRAHETSTVGSHRRDARAKLLSGLPVTERRYELAGISTAVLEGGQGAPLIFLHGPGEHAGKWLRLIPELALAYRFIAPDLPGHGETEPADMLDVDRTLAWLQALVERTCEQRPVLIAQIVGGAIAARFAYRRADRLRGLVLVDTLGLAPFQPAPEFMRALVGYMMQPSEVTHDALWQQCAFDLGRLQRELGESWPRLKAYNLLLAAVDELRPTQERIMQQFGMPPIPPAELEGITVPAALIWGRDDLATPLGAAAAASQRYGWPLHVIDDAADDPPLEQPAAFLAALRGAIAAFDSRAAWDKIASGYDETNTPTQMRIAAEGLRRAGVRAGTRFLDVAAGSGALAIPAARLGAEVTAIDQSAAMLELLRRRAQREGLSIQTRTMDGNALKFEAESFDVAGSQFGVMVFPDKPKALGEMVRVVKPGGRVLFHAYGDPSKIDFLNFFIQAIRAVRPGFEGPPHDPPPPEFELADPSRLRAALEAAGLKNVSVETIEEVTEFASGKELWKWIISSNPIAEGVLVMLAITNHERGTIERALDELVRQRAAGSGVATLTNPVHVGIGTK